MDGLRRHGSRIRNEHKRRHFPRRFGECVVKDQCIIPAFAERYVVGSLRDLVGFAFAYPLRRFQTGTTELLDQGGGGRVVRG